MFFRRLKGRKSFLAFFLTFRGFPLALAHASSLHPQSQEYLAESFSGCHLSGLHLPPSFTLKQPYGSVRPTQISQETPYSEVS
jgi:hypothetical protein